MKYRILMAGALAILSSACGSDNGGKATNVVNAPASEGKILFTKNCTQCHSVSRDMTGPKLAGVIARWKNDTTKLIAFVKEPARFITAEGEASYIGKLYKEWYQVPMLPHNDFTDAEIMQIIRYADAGKE